MGWNFSSFDFELTPKLSSRFRKCDSGHVLKLFQAETSGKLWREVSPFFSSSRSWDKMLDVALPSATLQYRAWLVSSRAQRAIHRPSLTADWSEGLRDHVIAETEIPPSSFLSIQKRKLMVAVATIRLGEDFEQFYIKKKVFRTLHRVCLSKFE